MTNTSEYKILVDWTDHGYLTPSAVGWKLNGTHVLEVQEDAADGVGGYETFVIMETGDYIFRDDFFGPAESIGEEVTITVFIKTGSDLEMGMDTVEDILADNTTTVFVYPGGPNQYYTFKAPLSSEGDFVVPWIKATENSIIEVQSFSAYRDIDEVTCDVAATHQTVTVSKGMDQGNFFATGLPGVIEFAITGEDRYFDANQTSSVKGNEVLIRLEDGAILLNGYIDDYMVSSDQGVMFANVSALDDVAYLDKIQINTEVFDGVTLYDALKSTCDEYGILFNDFASTWSYTSIKFLSHKGTFKSFLDRLVELEGPDAFYYMKDKYLVFHGRNFFEETDTIPVMSLSECSDYTYDINSDFTKSDAYRANVIDMEVNEPFIDAVTSDIYSSSDTNNLSSPVTLVGNTPFIDGEKPTLEVTSGKPYVKTWDTSRAGARITVAPDGESSFENLKQQGREVLSKQITFQKRDGVSLSSTGRPIIRSITTNGIPESEASALATVNLKQLANGRIVATMVIWNQEGTDINVLADTKTGDIVEVTSVQQSLNNEDFIVQSVTHEIESNDSVHALIVVAIQRQAAVPQINGFTFGVQNSGFDQGAFVFTSGDANQFIFGAEGRGFDDGQFGPVDEVTNVPFICGQSALDGTDELWY